MLFFSILRGNWRDCGARSLCQSPACSLRDIPVYEGWVDDKSASFGHNVDEFVVALQDIIDGKVDKREEGYKVAESRSIDDVAQKLVEAYKEVLEI